MPENVILVTPDDQPLGAEEKLKAHLEGKLHRAFSVFIFNSQGEMLLQRRALHKYHSPGLWSNACCSHPRPGEDSEAAAHRRMKEEMGFDCHIERAFQFTYKAEFDNGLTENELDHVFIGEYNGVVQPNPEEVAEYRWIDADSLKKDVQENPEQYTYWFCVVLDKVLKYYRRKGKIISD